MTIDLNKEQTRSIKKSYLNILALFLEQEKIESRFLRCLLKWGFQLNLHSEDLTQASIDVSTHTFSMPKDKVERLEAIYHLVHMIYLDEVVEDVELEVATIYAERLGFKSGLVSELFTSIVTADEDSAEPRNVRQEVLDFLSVYEEN
jgi:hypothetical protein